MTDHTVMGLKKRGAILNTTGDRTYIPDPGRGAATRVISTVPAPSPCACLAGASEAHNAMHSRYPSRVGHAQNQSFATFFSFPIISDLVVP